MKNITRKYSDFLFEKKIIKEKSNNCYDYGCAMLYFDFPEMGSHHNLIQAGDIYNPEGDRSYGLETEPHITLLYGIHSDVSETKVFESVRGINISNIVLHNVSVFNNAYFDVLKWDVTGDNIYKANESLCELPHTTNFPDYHPHCTIAYLKPGTSGKYIKILKDKEFKVKPKSVVYSHPNGTIYKIRL